MNTITDTLRSALIEAFHASRLTNAEFAKRVGMSEPMAWRLHQPDETPKLENIERGLKALGKRIEIRILPLAIALAILPAFALAQLPYNPPACVITAHLVINTYTSPIDIDNVCLTATTYTGGRLEFTGIDLADGIFRDGFDGAQP